MTLSMRRKFIIAAGVSAACLLSACGGNGVGLGSSSFTVGETFPEAGGELVVATLQGPTSYMEDEQGETGYEVELVQAFAAANDLTVRFVVKRDIEALLDAVANGEVHLAAAGLTNTEARRAAQTQFGPAYKNVRQQLVCRGGAVRPSDIDELDEARISVVAGSSYVETLEGLKEDNPDIGWTTRQAGSAMPLLAAVERGQIDCTVADSNLVAYARRRHPDLVVPMELSEDQPLAWVRSTQVEGLEPRLEAWFAQAHQNDYLQALDERWYGHFDEFDYVDVVRFIERLDERLPRYRSFFEMAAQDTPFDWPLLAAQAYQESHWDPDAVSATGVRGLMMLTLATASEVGIENRLDPRQSVQGGAEYLANLYDRIPDGVEGEDRLWFALAAYNVGMGHIYDARRLAERRGLDKNSWEAMEEVLPLLSQREYYTTVRHGYARGHEPVQYVRKIREYYAMLHANLQI
ncbi:membrane-bound lytic murein transglycosylase MltF [Marinicauda pacifica]|uniref:Membrane-bound lytic murein transglycosylase F n=1 Tax=Marinicauda pacifica TaxID=1133559 RepID=A0A4V3RZL0_9PROT|nr:membrane-bound lytic murein transglycosylase MltF [Marinicauda pacifica]TGY94669.1 membrane-bound lytic murein transglycosylase MltF [Marinicauda pacifica]